MTIIHRSALVRFPAQTMFDLVEDIESYPKFLPWCRATRILSREGCIVEAELEVARGGFRKAFTTRNTANEQGEIRMMLIDGPFRYLEGAWKFLPLREDASKISLDLDFELSGTLTSLAFGAVFNQICDTMVNAFSQRAKALYG